MNANPHDNAAIRRLQYALQEATSLDPALAGRGSVHAHRSEVARARSRLFEAAHELGRAEEEVRNLRAALVALGGPQALTGFDTPALSTELGAPLPVDLGLLTHRYDATHWFPFIEDESGCITGPGHQDHATFVSLVHQYDVLASGADSEPHTAEQVQHGWAQVSPSGEHLTRCDPEAIDAVPVTMVWGHR